MNTGLIYKTIYLCPRYQILLNTSERHVAMEHLKKICNYFYQNIEVQTNNNEHSNIEIDILTDLVQ